MKIINLFTGERINCDIRKATKPDIISCKQHFSFNWIGELQRFEIYKLVTEENPEIVQALLSLKIENEYIWLNKIERSNFKDRKVYEGITQLAIAFSCKLSFDAGFDGYVSFEAKSKLIAYYHRIVGAVQIGRSQRMIIPSEIALNLIALFYEEE